MLARHEQALQLSVLDHLREIDARRLYLRLGYSSLFDYTVRELHYTEAAAWRRIKAMRLCRETRGVRERLQDGSLNLSNAALLQNSFERWERSGGGPLAAGPPAPGRDAAGPPGAGQGAAGSAGAGRGAAGSGAAGTSAVPGAGSPPAAPGTAAGAPVPVLDAHARQELVERAMNMSTRQVQQMLAEVDPEAAAPAERLRALGDGRWELKAVVDDECQRGLQQLRELRSHVDPHLTVGQLVGRLVREGVERYDPSRPPRRKRRKSDPAGDECAAETAGRETADRVAAAAAAENPHRSEKSAVATTSPAAPKRSAKPTAVDTSPAVMPAGEGAGEASSKRRLAPPPGSPTSAPKCVAPRAERAGSADGALATEPTSAAKSCVAAGNSISEQSADGAGSAGRTSTAKHRVAAGASTPDRSAGGAGSAQRTSTAKPRAAAGGSTPDRSAGGAGSAQRTSTAKPRAAAGGSTPDRSAGGAGSAGQTSTAKPRAAAGGSPPDRSAGGAGSAQRTSTAKSPNSRVASGRSIPAAVRREVWTRDQGCCSYVDRHTGRRCSSRFFLELDHIVPVARGGAAEPADLRLRCAAHHRYRHGRRQRSAPRDSVT